MSSLRPILGAAALAVMFVSQPAGAACPAPATWMAPGGATIEAPTLIAAMSRKQAVLLGEQHDNEDHHRWQLQVIAALHAQRPDMVLGFEMFPRRVQPVLDRWVAGELSQQQLLEQTGWSEVWSFPPALYMPMFEFARLNRIPMLALNIDRKLSRAVSTRGWDAVPPADREGVGRPAPPSDAYRDYLLDIYRMHASHGKPSRGKPSAGDTGFRYFVESQQVWDRAMAEAIAVAARRGALLVGVMGGGHVRHGYGVPHQLRDLGIREIGTLLPLGPEESCERLAPGLADAVFAVPPAPAANAPEPPRLGVRLEETDTGVRIAEVSAGSLAERSGMRADDRLVEVGGRAVSRARAVMDAVRQQPAGTWLPVRVARGEQLLDLVVRFPVRP
ncbi:ChaN family lipoprotein [Noviherbaspirillum aridicola]|uniref:PDZ domain-containing protein n=1 Tax=Noviherbaspirillum aridicola TaxID=2849687 RepID=A0ABQ4Q694_9BURK|nr:ChaN family lipoprotein [Noviherbaspirillum aridicola]GIZ52713.1 hypothetical protein NCCP691_27270 [Noviherbaspirillum aridicola]